MKKTLILAASLVVMCSMIGCSENEPSDSKKSSDTAESSSVSQVSEESSVKELQSSQQAEEKAAVSAAASEEEPVRAQGEDPFKGLEVQFDGISPYGNVSFNNSGCSKSVQENVEFTFDEEQSIANGNKIIVKAQIAENAPDPELDLLMTEKEYTVEGLPYYVEDFSKINCEALDEEIQQYMDSHYLYSNKYDKIMQYKEIYGDGWGSRGIMGVRLDKPLESFHYEALNESAVEDKYAVVIKPNYVSECKVEDADHSRLSEKNTYNYYYVMYKNNYTVRENNGLKTDWDFDKEKSYTVDVYACIYVKNVIADPDGTLRYDKELDYNTNAVKEQAYFEGMSSKSDGYNIKKL